MAAAASLLLVASNFCVAVCLLLTAQQVHGALQVDPEDIHKTIKVHVFIVLDWNSVGSVYIRSITNLQSLLNRVQSKNGVVIDCVHIHKQPTLKHPLFKDHKIQVHPLFSIFSNPNVDRPTSIVVDDCRS